MTLYSQRRLYITACIADRSKARALNKLIVTPLIAIWAWMMAAVLPANVLANGWEHVAVPFEALLAGLRFEEETTRARSAESLGYRGHPDAVQPLLDALQRPEPSPLVRGAIYHAFGDLGDPAALEALTACLAAEQRAELRAVCVFSLGEIGGAVALDAVLSALDGDQDMLVRSRAVDALGLFGNSRVVAALAQLVNPATKPSALTRADAALRARAIAALGRTGVLAAAAPLLRALSAAEQDPARLPIVMALAQIGAPSSRAPLETLLEETGDPRLRTAITIALSALSEDDLRPALERLLRDPVPTVRLAAVQGLADLGDASAVPALTDLAASTTEALYRLDAAELVADAAATVDRASLLLKVVQTITALDAKQGLEVFLRVARPIAVDRTSVSALAVANALYQLRRAALFGLGYTGSDEAATLVSGAAGIGDADFRLRAVAARSLAVLRPDDAVPKLIGLLADPKADVRWTAATGLGRLEDERAVVPLLARLDDNTARVRREAASGLGFLGDPRAREALLISAESDPDPAVRKAAAFAASLLE